MSPSRRFEASRNACSTRGLFLLDLDGPSSHPSPPGTEEKEPERFGEKTGRLVGILLLLVTSLTFVGCGPKDPTIEAPQVAVLRISAMTPDRATSNLGRGFLISADGLIVTSLHLIDGAQDITVVRDNGEKMFADFVQGDKDGDLALIRVHGKDLPFLKLSADDDLEPGLHVRLLGTAGTTHGVFDHWEDFGEQMHATVSMLPTDGGSPLLGDDGRVIAIARGPITAKPSESTATPVYRIFKMMPSLQHQSWLP